MNIYRLILDCIKYLHPKNKCDWFIWVISEAFGTLSNIYDEVAKIVNG